MKIKIPMSGHSILVIVERSRKMAALGYAVNALARVVSAIQDQRESVDEGQCARLMAEIDTGYVLGGVQVAMAELGACVSSLAETMVEDLEQQESLVRSQQQ